ncbi:MAG: SpoIIE family protein phosphatase [Acidimicrobiia bacterium]
MDEHERLLRFLYMLPTALVEFDESGAISLVTPAAANLLVPLYGPDALSDVYTLLGDSGAMVRAAVLESGQAGKVVDRLEVVGVARVRWALEVTVVRVDDDRLLAVFDDVSAASLEREVRARLGLSAASEAAGVAVELAASYLGAAAAVLRAPGKMGFEAVGSSADESLVGDPSLSQACADGGEVLTVADLAAWTGVPFTGEVTAAMAVPVRAGDELLCVLELYYRPAPSFDDAYRALVGRFAAALGADEAARVRQAGIEVLAESESRLRTVFAAIDDGYCLCEMIVDANGDPVDYRFLETNALFETMTGLADAVGRTALELVPDLEAVWVETYARVGLGGETLRFQQGSEAMGRWFDVFTVPVQPYGRFAIVFRDRTVAHRAEVSLRTSEALFRTLADDLPVLVWVQDDTGAQRWVNRSFCEFFGVERDAMVGDRWQQLVHPGDAPALMASYEDALRRGVGFHAEVRVRRADGVWRWIESWVHPRFEGDGEFAGHIGASADVTERKELEASLEQARELAEAARRREEAARKRVELMQELVNRLDHAPDVRRGVERLAELVIERLGDFAVIEEPDVDGDAFLLVCRHRDPAKQRTLEQLRRRFRLGRNEPRSLWRAAHGEAQLVQTDVPGLAGEYLLESEGSRLLAELGPRSHVAVPLRLGSGRHGALMVGITDPERERFGHDDLELIRELADRAGLKLDRAEIADQERQVSLRLQRALLPDSVVQHPDVALAVHYVAASELLDVGGDWYDTLQWDDGQVGVAVGDVVGHGVEAAAAMGRLRAAFSAFAPLVGPHPAELLTALDRFANGPDGVGFLTACVAVLDPGTGLLRYASAGHPPMLLVNADGSHRWLQDGRSVPVAGLRPDTRPEASLQLSPGSTVVLYSDGLIERRREDLQRGFDRIAAAATSLAELAAHDIPDRLCEAIGGADELADDLVIACLRYQPHNPVDRAEDRAYEACGHR